MSGKRIWVFNLMLGVLLVWGAMKLRESWTAFGATHGAGQIQGQLGAAETPRAAQAAPGPVSEGAWAEIGARNPFSVDRNDIDVVEVAPPPVSTPKPILFGTLLLGSERLALLGKAGAGSQDRRSVKVGEDFDGWRIVEIVDKSVVVAANGAQESLVVGKVPAIDRRSERTASPVMASAPAALQSAPAATAAPSRTAPSPASSGVGNLPAVLPPGTHIVHTPFGDKIERLPQ